MTTRRSRGVYRWEADSWSEARWATSDRPVFGKGRLWQHSLSIAAPRGSRRASDIQKNATLPPGRYLAKIYIDQHGRLQKNFRAELSESELVGTVELQSRWPAGYGKMTVITFPGE